MGGEWEEQCIPECVSVALLPRSCGQEEWDTPHQHKHPTLVREDAPGPGNRWPTQPTPHQILTSQQTTRHSTTSGNSMDGKPQGLGESLGPETRPQRRVKSRTNNRTLSMYIGTHTSINRYTTHMRGRGGTPMRNPRMPPLMELHRCSNRRSS